MTDAQNVAYAKEMAFRSNSAALVCKMFNVDDAGRVSKGLLYKAIYVMRQRITALEKQLVDSSVGK